MSGFLDYTGLSHFWTKVESALAKKQNSLIVGDGLVSLEDRISVEKPIKTVTQAEYDSLSEEEKLSDVVFLITDGDMVEDPTAEVYGVLWDGSSSTKWTRTDDAALFFDPIPYVAGATDYKSPFDSIMPWSGMVKVERACGTMVAIPKFWYKLTQVGEGMQIQITNRALPGFMTSPAHMDRGDGVGERDVVYIGRYHSGDDYRSVTGASPKVLITRSAARSEIHKLGSTVWQMDFATRFTIWLLYLVEFADWDSQAKIGFGCGDGSSVGNVGYTDDMPYHTGTMHSSRETYGLGTQYRNIEGVWDNVYDWCDGCYNNSSGFNIITDPNKFSDSSGGLNAGLPADVYDFPGGFTVSSSGGFALFYPNKEGGTETTFSTDFWNFKADAPCVPVGGFYNQKRGRGMFTVVYQGVSGSLKYIGTRIEELPN